MEIEQQNIDTQEPGGRAVAGVGILAIGVLIGAQVVAHAERACVQALHTQHKYEMLYLAQRLQGDAANEELVHNLQDGLPKNLPDRLRADDIPRLSGSCNRVLSGDLFPVGSVILEDVLQTDQ